MRCFTSLPSLRFARGHALLSAVAVFSVVLLASALYTLTRPKLYEAVASFDDLAPQDPKEFEHTLQSIQVTYDDCVRFAESTRMIQRVAARITGDDLERMLTPYASRGERNAALLDSVLISNRHIKTMPSTGSVSVAYRHPDPEIAAAVANMFIDELIQWTSRLRLDRKIRDVEMIQITKQTLAKQVEELSQQLASLGNSPPEPHAEKNPQRKLRRHPRETEFGKAIIGRRDAKAEGSKLDFTIGTPLGQAHNHRHAATRLYRPIPPPTPRFGRPSRIPIRCYHSPIP